MSITADRPQTTPVAQPEPAGVTEPAAEPSVAEKLGLEERPWLLVAGVVLFIALAFTALVGLTVLAGGDGYPR